MKEPGKPANDEVANRRTGHVRNLSTPGVSRKTGERTPLLRRRSFEEPDASPEDEAIPSTTLAGGTVLGIHNLAIVAPQFIVRSILTVPYRLILNISSR